MGILAAEWPHYQLREIRSMREIRDIFQPDTDPRLNWFFCSAPTSGGSVHGTNITLDEVEALLKSGGGSDGKYWITVMIVQPRLCNLFYGEIKIGKGDISYLRQLVRTTLEVIPQTQEGNT